MNNESPPASNSHQPTSFEEGLARLGDIVARLEAGSLGLSESIAAYEHGVTILRELHTELASVEERVSRLVKIDDDGRPILEPLATESPPAPSPQSGRKPPTRAPGGARRKSNVLPGMDDAREDA